MPDENEYLLWCCISDEPDSNYFPVRTLKSAVVSELKNSIKKTKAPELDNFAANHLVLWRVSIPLTEFKSSSADIRYPQEIVGSKGLEPSERLLDLFEPFKSQDLHIIVKRPELLKRFRSPSAEASSARRKLSLAHDANNYPRYTPREQTVSNVYNKLNRLKYIQVRGTPASGKSTLAHLVIRHIEQLEPNTLITHIVGWTKEEYYKTGIIWLSEVHKWDHQPGSVLVVDEAQASYWDNLFWNMIKAIRPEAAFRVITFASFGNDRRGSGELAHIIPKSQIITLDTTDRGDNIKVGLRLTKEEFDDFVKIVFLDHYFDHSLLESILELTSGHVGACEDLLCGLLGHSSYAAVKRQSDALYTLETFMNEISMSQIVSWIENGVSSRGLPEDIHFQQPNLHHVLLQVVNDGYIMCDDEFDEPSPTTLAVRRCYKAGWFHCVTRVEYVFASPIHRRFVEAKILGPVQGHIKEDTALTFAIAVIRRFSPLHLRAKRELGATTQPTPEAQFQSEFYRASLAHTKDLALSFPEFGNKNDRIDFYIPSKKWGIELLRDGTRIKSHFQRFTEGEYSRWIANKWLDDYVILDFRTSFPHGQHEEIKNLYYIVSEGDWKSVTVLDSKKKQVVQFQLL